MPCKSQPLKSLSLYRGIFSESSLLITGVYSCQEVCYCTKIQRIQCLQGRSSWVCTWVAVTVGNTVRLWHKLELYDKKRVYLTAPPTVFFKTLLLLEARQVFPSVDRKRWKWFLDAQVPWNLVEFRVLLTQQMWTPAQVPLAWIPHKVNTFPSGAGSKSQCTQGRTISSHQDHCSQQTIMFSGGKKRHYRGERYLAFFQKNEGSKPSHICPEKGEY